MDGKELMELVRAGGRDAVLRNEYNKKYSVIYELYPAEDSTFWVLNWRPKRNPTGLEPGLRSDRVDVVEPEKLWEAAEARIDMRIQRENARVDEERQVMEEFAASGEKPLGSSGSCLVNGV